MTELALPTGLDQAFRVEDGSCRLLAARCPRSGRVFFPAPAFCPCCLEPPETAPLSGDGRIHAVTHIRTKAPFGLPEPYAVGYIDLETAPLRVFGLFAPCPPESLQPEAVVELVALPLGVDNQGQACLRPVFRLTGGGHV